MKKLALLFGFLMVFTGVEAKKVKFSVDMTGQVIDSMGVHIAGDFQTLAGYSGGDWMPNTTQMFNDSSVNPNIYSVVVDIPAFAKYEFVFVNGDQGYQQEFVPYESRVLYNFNSNRWIYIDSLANDTQSLAPVMFAGNAPIGQYLLRYRVEMLNITINAAGVHVNNDLQNWAQPAFMWTFDSLVYEYITYSDTLDSALVTEFIYMNGDQAGTEETVPTSCATANNKRGVQVPRDTIIDAVCFSACVNCSAVGIATVAVANEQLLVQPNPATDEFSIRSSGITIAEIQIRDLSGRLIRAEAGNGSSVQFIQRGQLPDGIYLIQTTDTEGRSLIRKVVFQ